MYEEGKSSDNIASFTAYSAESIINTFHIAAIDSIEARAIRFVHRSISDNFGEDYNGRSKIEFARDMVDFSIEEIDFRYTLLTSFAPEFFKTEEKIDFDALTLAVITGAHVGNINGQVFIPAAREHDNDNEMESYTRDDGFDEDLALRAKNLREDAEDLKSYGFYDEQKPEPIVFFLAQILAMEELRNIEETFIDPDDNDLDVMELFLLNRRSADIMTICMSSSDISTKLMEFLDRVETRMVDVLNDNDRSIGNGLVLRAPSPLRPAQTTPSKKPELSLVPHGTE